eukprot:2168464-Amphidinium_carterae.1
MEGMTCKASPEHSGGEMTRKASHGMCKVMHRRWSIPLPNPDDPRFTSSAINRLLASNQAVHCNHFNGRCNDWEDTLTMSDCYP